jgi:hypothetical protein
MNTLKQTRAGLVICIRNDGYEVSLERRKIYEALVDTDARKHHQIRVIDESGEDYLFPEDFFVPVQLPRQAERAVIEAA